MWFQFGDIHSEDLNIKVLRFRKSAIPIFNDQRETIPGMDGTVVFPQPFEQKTIEIECLLKYDDKNNKRAENRLLSKLFSRNEEKLIISDENDVFYIGKLSGSFTPEQYKTMSHFTLTFICQPFAYSLQKKIVSSEKNSADIFTITSDGTAYSEFKLTIAPQETIENVSIKVGDALLIYEGEVEAGKSLVIDTEEFEAYLDAKNVTLNLSGEFPVLYPGENTIQITANKAFNYEATFEYYDRFL